MEATFKQLTCGYCKRKTEVYTGNIAPEIPHTEDCLITLLREEEEEAIARTSEFEKKFIKENVRNV